MLSWDLIETPLARSDGPVRVPSEPELIALSVALMAVENVLYTELGSCVLRLTEGNREEVADFLTCQLPIFRGVLGSREELRKRLVELTGITVTDS